MLLVGQWSLLPAYAAENSRNHFYLGAAAGLYDLDSKTDLDATLGYGARLGYLFDGEDLGDTLGVEGRVDAGTVSRQEGGEVDFFIGRLAGIYPLVFDKSWTPYFILGAGVVNFAENDIADSGPLLSLGAGLEYSLAGNLHVRAEAESFHTFEAENNHHVGYTLGLVYRFRETKKKEGPPSDKDHDGVSDKKDECSGTPRGSKVDERGCALDTSDGDRDGVPAYKDKCLESPGDVKVDDSGCPVDEDQDGIPDFRDGCPGTPRGVEVNRDGCVGSESKGERRNLSGVAGTSATAGPGRGEENAGTDPLAATPITVARDRKEAANADLSGGHNEQIEAEASGEGPIAVEACKPTNGPTVERQVIKAHAGLEPAGKTTSALERPQTPATSPRNGVPEGGKKRRAAGQSRGRKGTVSPKILLPMDGGSLLARVWFEPYQIMPESAVLSTLQEVSRMLKASAEKCVVVEGHTDSSGGRELNRKLSRQRASSVQRLLVESGVEPEQVEVAYFGESRPLFDNGTRNGRRKNRRAEIWVR